MPKLCRDKKAVVITTHDKPVSVLLPIKDYEALIKTMELLAHPKKRYEVPKETAYLPFRTDSFPTGTKRTLNAACKAGKRQRQLL